MGYVCEIFRLNQDKIIELQGQDPKEIEDYVEILEFKYNYPGCNKETVMFYIDKIWKTCFDFIYSNLVSPYKDIFSATGFPKVISHEIIHSLIEELESLNLNGLEEYIQQGIQETIAAFHAADIHNQGLLISIG